MADISHKNLPEADLHELKGASTATQYTLPQASGTGATSWVKPQIEQSISSAGSALVHEIPHSNGSGGFIWSYGGGTVYGEMIITGNSTGITPGSACLDFANDTYYTKVTPLWQAGSLDGITFNVDELVVPVAGDYKVEFWASMTGPNGAVIGFKYAINDTTPYSTRKALRKQGGLTDVGSISATGIVPGLSANDTISIYVAEDVITSGVIIKEAGLTVTLVKDGRL